MDYPTVYETPGVQLQLMTVLVTRLENHEYSIRTMGTDILQSVKLFIPIQHLGKCECL